MSVQCRRLWRGDVTQNSINIGASTTLLGSIAIDGAEVAGIGDLVAPQLVVPFVVRLNNQPREAAVALLELRARLSMPRSEGALVLSSAERRWLGGPSGLRQTFDHGSHDYQEEWQFPLHGASVRPLERAGAQTAPGDVALKLDIEATAAWIARTWNNIPPDPNAVAPPAASRYGLMADLQFLETVTVGDLTIYVPRERWAEAVLPGLGLQRTRLVAVRLPPEDRFGTTRIPKRFDAARRALDAGRFEECIRDCRQIREIVQRRLIGSGAGRVATAIARRRGLPEDAPQIRFLGEAWTSLVTITNAAVHDDPDEEQTLFAATDARSCLLLTAVLLEHLVDELELSR
jgi:hypothetical protein